MGLFRVKPDTVDTLIDVIAINGYADPRDSLSEDLQYFPEVKSFRTTKIIWDPSSVIYPRGYTSQVGIDVGRLVVGVSLEDSEDQPFTRFEVVTPNDMMSTNLHRGVEFKDEFAKYGIAKALFNTTHQIGHSPNDQRHIQQQFAAMRNVNQTLGA